MADVKSRADIVAERLESWAPDLEAIERTREQQAADEARADEFGQVIVDLQTRALARLAYLENCAALGIAPEADQTADEAIAILEQLAAAAPDDED